MNNVNLIGRLTREPEVRSTPAGAIVTSFTVAINRTFKSSDGQEADYINCLCWNKLADNVGKYTNKGSLVGISGELRSRSYTNSKGDKVYVTEVVCSSVQFLQSKRDNNSQVNFANSTPTQNQTFATYNDIFPTSPDEQGFTLEEDDVQF